MVYRTYVRDAGQSTWYGQQFTFSDQHKGVHSGTHYASIMMISKSVAILYSMAITPPEPVQSEDFKGQLESFGNPSLWNNLSFDGNGSWI